MGASHPKSLEYATGNTSLNNFTSDEAFVLSNGTLTVANTGSINNTFTLSGGTANFNGLSSVNSLNFTGGTIGGEGNLTLNGTSTWSRGTMQDTGSTIVASGASLDIVGDPTLQFLKRTIDNQGTINFIATQIDFEGNGIINNQGEFNSIGQGRFARRSGSNNAFNNQGNFNRSGAGTTISDFTFNNSGTVNISEGTLALSGGGTHSGDFIGAGTLQLGGVTNRTHTFNSESLLTVGERKKVWGV